jgi:hypothetical protein
MKSNPLALLLAILTTFSVAAVLAEPTSANVDETGPVLAQQGDVFNSNGKRHEVQRVEASAVAVL